MHSANHNIIRVTLLAAVMLFAIALNAADTKLDSLRSLLRVEKNDTAQVNLRFKIAGILIKEDSMAAGKEIDAITGILKKVGNAVFVLKTIDRIGRLYNSYEMQSKASEFFNKGLSQAKQLKMNDWIVKFFSRIGFQIQNEGFSKQCITYFDSALMFTKGIDDKIMADLCKNKGRAHYDIGEYKIAMQFYVQSQQIYEKNKLYNVDYGHLLHYIGSVFKRQNQLDKALMYYEKELDLARQIKDKGLEAEALYLSAAMYGEQGQLFKELEYELQALEIYKQLGNDAAEALLLGNISGYYASRKDYKKAIEYALKSLEIYEREGDVEKESWVFGALGDYYSRLGQYKLALDYLAKAEKVIMKVETKQLLYLTDIKHTKAFTYAGMNDYRKAFDLLLEHMALKDSLENKENREYLHNIETQYETEKKEKEIALLNKDKEMQSAELDAKNAVLTQKETQRNALIIVVILVLIIAGFSIYAFLNKKRITQILAKQVDEINHKNLEIQEKNKDITDSIQYAKRLQEAVFPDPAELSNFFSDSFILFRPKDIVSGDFYWFEEFGNKALLVVGDCTGHGVPGAFMSIMGHNLLNQIVMEEKIWEPAKILKELDLRVLAVLNKKMSTQGYQDGMDMAVCLINKRENKVTFAGANRPLLVNRGGNVIEIKPNKFPIGGAYDSTKKVFTQHDVKLEDNDLLYMFSDGYHDQFGGPKGKKFKYKHLQDVLMTTSQKGLKEQGVMLDHLFEEWMGSLEQLDDVTVIGIKLT